MSQFKPDLKPAVWQAPPRPARSRERTGTQPMTARHRIHLPGVGPEDVVFGTDGHLYTGIEDGRILSIDPATYEVKQIAQTSGRPLGLHAETDGRLLVCDAYRGLLRTDPATGRLQTLLTTVDGESLRCCSNATVTADGTIFLTDSSRRFDLHHWKGDLLEHSGTGRLIRLPPTGKPEVVLDGLHFANGVTLSRDESFLIVAESGAYRIRRVYLTGPQAGTADVFAENLPGFPDNLSTGPGGVLWAALAGAREPQLDFLLRSAPVLRRALWRLPGRLLPNPRPTAWIMGFDDDGRLIHDMQRGDLDFRMVTSACETSERLFLGSLVESALLELDRPTGSPDPS